MTNTAQTDRLADLEHAIHAHPGEFILILEHSEKYTPGTGGCFGYPRVERIVERYIGILAADTIDFQLNRATTFPTSAYANTNKYSFQLEQTVEAWGIGSLFSPQLADLLTTKIDYQKPYDRELYPDDHALDLIIGDDAVTAFFMSNNQLSGILYPERSVLWYQQAARLLGRPLAEAPELNQHEAIQRAQLLEQLWTLEAEMAPHRQRITTLAKAKSSGGIYTEGGAIGVIEGDDSFRIHTMRDRESLSRLESKLANVITRLTELGVGDHPYVLAFKLRYNL